MSSTLHSHTPALTALDSRGLAVRSVRWYRAEDGAEAEARVAHSRLDSMGRIVEQRDARLFVSAGTRPNLAKVYSLSGNVLLSDSVDAGLQVLLHCEDGLPDERRDGRGTRTRYEYDGLRRVIGVYESSSDEPERCAERFLYGDDQADTSYNLRRQTLRHDDPAGTRHMHAYDLKGLPQQERQHFLDSLEPPDWPDDSEARDALLEPGDGMLSQWAYSPWGELLKMTDAAGNAHQQRFDIAGHLAVSTLQPADQESPTTLVEQIHYNAFDQVQSQVAGNGLITETSYDPADGRLSRLLCKPANDAPALQDISYFYDPVGNVVRHEDHSIESRYHSNRRIDPVSEFSYDSLYQLIEASGRERLGAGRGPELPGVIDFSGNDESLIGSYTRRYQYDAGGNLLLMQHQGQNGQEHSLRMAVSNLSNKSIPWREGLSDEQIENTFNANGNLCQLQPGQKMDWDLRNQLSQVSLVERENGQSDTERYIYGGGGKRLRKYANRQASGVMHHSETRYLPGLELHEDSATGQRYHVVNINAGRGKIRWMHWLSTPPAGLPENSLYYGFDNQLGSVTLETDEHGQVASREEYYPFGGTALIASRNEVEVSFKTIRYSGKERDATGLYYYGYRYLAPWLCRWLNPDPAGTVDGLNLFGFVGNNPLTWVDGDGRVKDYPSLYSWLSEHVDEYLAEQQQVQQQTPAGESRFELLETVEYLSPFVPTANDAAPMLPPPEQPTEDIVQQALERSGALTPGPPAAIPSSSRTVEGEIAVGTVALSEQIPEQQATTAPPKQRKTRKTQSKIKPSTRILPTPNTAAQSEVIKPFACKEPGCTKRFASAGGLTNHDQKIHWNIPKFRCEECTYRGFQKTAWEDHLRTHTKEKPFVCDICQRAFGSRYTLAHHKNYLHLKLKPHVCPLCARPFARRSHLAKHMKRIHGQE